MDGWGRLQAAVAGGDMRGLVDRGEDQMVGIYSNVVVKWGWGSEAFSVKLGVSVCPKSQLTSYSLITCFMTILRYHYPPGLLHLSHQPGPLHLLYAHGQT